MPANTLQLTWTDANWALIQKTVHDEAARLRVARQFLSLQTPQDASTISADLINVNGERAWAQRGIEIKTKTIEIVELAVNVFLTPQAAAESDLHSAVSLFTYAANLIAHAEDTLVFQGGDVIRRVDTYPVFRAVRVTGDAGSGLLDRNEVETVRVEPVDGTYTSTLYAAVAKAATEVQANHAGRLALVLPSRVYPDAFRGQPGSRPKDEIEAFVGDRFYASNGLPDDRGLVLALDGNTMDLVVTLDATPTFLQVDAQGRFDFSVSERIALRVKDPTAVARLEFAPAKKAEEVAPASEKRELSAVGERPNGPSKPAKTK